MSVQLEVPYETLVALVAQLSDSQQHDLIARIQRMRSTRREARKAAFASMIVDLGPVSADYSDRREDWYDDDGR